MRIKDMLYRIIYVSYLKEIPSTTQKDPTDDYETYMVRKK